MSDRSQAAYRGMRRFPTVRNCGCPRLSIADATLASAFVARWCVGAKVEAAAGRVSGSGGRAGTAGRGEAAQDTVSAGTSARTRSGRPSSSGSRSGNTAASSGSRAVCSNAYSWSGRPPERCLLRGARPDEMTLTRKIIDGHSTVR